jgi:hypothetical protein
MNAGMQHSWRTRLRHALVITIGLYLATLPMGWAATRRFPSRTELIEKFPASQIYLVNWMSGLS